MKQNILRMLFGITPLFAGLVVSTPTMQAATIWTDWTSTTIGANGGGSATGNLGGVAVNYSGELDAAVVNGTSNIWLPATSFLGGTVSATPATPNDDLRLNGSSTGTNTVTFGSPIVNPVFAIWSLGTASTPATFAFNQTPAFEAGGPNSGFGGSAITLSGNTVSGREGNGVVQFTGTFSSISWTNTFENYYAFTVGMNGALDGGAGPSPVPEPGTWALALGGMAVVFVARRVRA